MGTGPDPHAPGWERIIYRFERVIIFTLMALLMAIIAISTVELAWLLVRDLSTVGQLLFDVHEMFEVFGFFLLVLIGVELLLSLKTYVSAGIVHVEVVLEVALIAMAQKIIVLDIHQAGALSVLSLAALVVALAVAYWLMRAARLRDRAASGKRNGAET
jgi:uncharacterized membrane protein (DUF373 family)